MDKLSNLGPAHSTFPFGAPSHIGGTFSLLVWGPFHPTCSSCCLVGLSLWLPETTFPYLEVSRFSHPTLWTCSQSLPQPQPLIKSTLLSEPAQTLPTISRRAGQGCPKKAGWEGSPRNHRPSMASQVCVPNKALHVKLPNTHDLAWEAPHSPTAQSPKPETPRPREALWLCVLPLPAMPSLAHPDHQPFAKAHLGPGHTCVSWVGAESLWEQPGRSGVCLPPNPLDLGSLSISKSL